MAQVRFFYSPLRQDRENIMLEVVNFAKIMGRSIALMDVEVSPGYDPLPKLFKVEDLIFNGVDEIIVRNIHRMPEESVEEFMKIPIVHGVDVTCIGQLTNNNLEMGNTPRRLLELGAIPTVIPPRLEPIITEDGLTLRECVMNKAYREEKYEYNKRISDKEAFTENTYSRGERATQGHFSKDIRGIERAGHTIK